MNTDVQDLGPLRVAARFLTPLEAQVFAQRLIEEGVVAQVMDNDSIYPNGAFTSSGLGGIRVMVPEGQLEQAETIRIALDAGEYAIDDDFDVGK